MLNQEDVALFPTLLISIVEDKLLRIEHHPYFKCQVGYSFVQFYIPVKCIQYIHLSCLELYANLQIEKEDREKFYETEEVSGLTIDLICHTMWSSVDIKLNCTSVSLADVSCKYKALIEKSAD